MIDWTIALYSPETFIRTNFLLGGETREGIKAGMIFDQGTLEGPSLIQFTLLSFSPLGSNGSMFFEGMEYSQDNPHPWPYHGIIITKPVEFDGRYLLWFSEIDGGSFLFYSLSPIVGKPFIIDVDSLAITSRMDF